MIELRNVTVYRGDALVFDRLSLRISPGENTAILGPNGAGKSTLLKLFAQEIYPVAHDDSAVVMLGCACDFVTRGQGCGGRAERAGADREQSADAV